MNRMDDACQQEEDLLLSDRIEKLKLKPDCSLKQQQQPQHQQQNDKPEYVVLCDMGFGLPKESRPRREKLLAMARQIVNFLWWQQQKFSDMGPPVGRTNHIVLKIVDCPDAATQEALQNRMNALWQQENDKQESETPIPFPSKRILFSETGLLDSFPKQTTNESDTVYYLSPDASISLDPSIPPPQTVIVGMLIDRRVQLCRSLKRAQALNIVAAQLPLEQAGIVLQEQQQEGEAGNDQDSPTQQQQQTAVFKSSEPLNVDCVLEMMQQWIWNCEQQGTETSEASEHCYQAMASALEHHAQKHPARVQHQHQ